MRTKKIYFGNPKAANHTKKQQEQNINTAYHKGIAVFSSEKEPNYLWKRQ
jgi:hypothetical protein